MVIDRSPVKCAQCGKDDQLQAVPAVYQAGRGQFTGTYGSNSVSLGVGFTPNGPGIGVGRSRTRGSLSGTSVSDLAAALEPRPAPAQHVRRLATIAVLLFAIGVFSLILGASGIGMHSAGERAQGAVMGLLSLAGAAFVGAWAAREAKTDALVLRGQSGALAVWSAASLCMRCGGVTLVGAPERDHRMLSLPEFQYQVWEAGGYGDLHLGTDMTS